MNKRYAIVRQGVVENVCIIDTDTPQGANFLAEQLALGLTIESLDSHVGVGTGWIYDAQAGTFSAPQHQPQLPTQPLSVTRRQFKQALTRIGLRAAVEAAISAADQDTKDWYADSLNFERSNPVMNGMAVALGKTPEDIDNLFRLAATL